MLSFLACSFLKCYLVKRKKYESTKKEIKINELPSSRKTKYSVACHGNGSVHSIILGKIMLAFIESYTYNNSLYFQVFYIFYIDGGNE